MAATPANGQAHEVPVHSMRLSELVGALSREFAAASASHHATLNHWKQVYEDSPVLADYNPDAMKVVSAQLSVPVALSQVTVRPAQAGRITRTMIAEALLPELPRSRRQELARAIHAEAGRLPNGLSFANPRLAANLDKIARRLVPEAKVPLDRQAIADLQREHLSQPDREAEIAVLYRAKDLQEVKPELTFRLNLELKLA